MSKKEIKLTKFDKQVLQALRADNVKSLDIKIINEEMFVTVKYKYSNSADTFNGKI